MRPFGNVAVWALGAAWGLAASGCFSEDLNPRGGGGTTGGSGGGAVAATLTGGVDTASTAPGDLTGGSGDSRGTTGVAPMDSTSDGDTTFGRDTTTEESSSTGSGVLSIDELNPGDLVITEVMWNPLCDFDDCEWFEIYNATAVTVNLLDLYVRDDENVPSNQGRVTADALLAAGEYAVLARSLTSWPYAFEATAVYGPAPSLNNGSPDRVIILNGDGNMLDQTPLLPAVAPAGQSWAFTGMPIDAAANDVPAQWCLSGESLATPKQPVGSMEFGSPLAANSECQ